MVPPLKGTRTIKFDAILSHYTAARVESITSPAQIDQVARAFLVYLLGSTLFPDTASSIDLMYLPPLQDLDFISSYDWGSAALSYLYHRMDALVRGAKRLCDIWHAILVGFLHLFSFILYTLSILSPISLS